MKKFISMMFQLQLIREILQKYHQNTNHHHWTGNNYPLQVTEKHFSSVYISVEKNRNRRYIICSANDKRSKSKYKYKNCNVGLCVDPYIKIYSQLYINYNLTY